MTTPPQTPTPAKLALSVAPATSAANRVALSTQPVVQLQDANGNSVAQAGTVVTVAIASGGGALGGTVTATTAANGAATFTDLVISGTVGPRTLTFSAGALTAANATVMVTPGTATFMTIVAGNGVAGTVGGSVTTLPAVRITDADSNAVPGVSVSFAVASGGGSVTGETQTTDSAGVARVGSWTLGTAAGANTLTATAANLTTVTFSAGGAPAAASKLVLLTAPSATAQSRIALGVAPVVQLQDPYGNVVAQAGTSVSAAISAGGGSLGGAATVATSAAGTATFAGLSLAGLAGPRTLTFSATGLTSVSAPVALSAGLPASVVIVSGNNASAVAGDSVTAKPTVRVTDADGNPVRNTSITFSVATGGGSVSGGNATTDSLGIASVARWTLGILPGVNTLTATATALPGAPLTFTATGDPRLVANSTSADTIATAPGAQVALPTGTTATVVSTSGGAATLALSEVAGANPTAGGDTTRFFVARVTGGATDTTVVNLSLLVSDAPAAGETQWLFARNPADPPGVGQWYQASAPTALMMAETRAPRLAQRGIRTPRVSAFASVNGDTKLTFTVSIPGNTDLRLYPLRTVGADPASCTSSRQFQLMPGGEQRLDPSISVVLIHGFQPSMKCAGVNIPSFTSIDDYRPESEWTALAAKIRARIPAANVYFVRYSTSAAPAEAGRYVRDQIAAMNPGGSTGPVVLVGHSMGGLVARYATNGPPAPGKVAQIITLGTPHKGAPLATLAGSVALFLATPGLASLAPNVVDNEIPLPAPVPLYAVRGNVPCGPQPPHTAWLLRPWAYLCGLLTESDALVPASSATPAGLVTEAYQPPLPAGGVDHVELRSNTDVIEKVVSWLELLPRFALSATSASFNAVRTGGNAPAQEISITNAGSGTLSGITIDGIAYETGEATGWLSASLSGATAPSSLTLSTAMGDLPAGAYHATVTLKSSATGVTNSPRTVSVTYALAAAQPTITLSQPSATFNGVAAGSSPVAQTIEVTNTGTGALPNLNAAVAYAEGQPTGWLAASLSSTSAPSTLTLAPALGALTAGTYTATVSVSSTVLGVTNSPQIITVSLVVAAGTPTIALSPSPVTFNTTAGDVNPPPQQVQLTNGSTGYLNGLSLGATEYAGGQPTGWLAVSLSGPSAPATISLSATTGSLSAGTYSAVIPVLSTALGVTNSPRALVVNFVVARAPTAAAETLFVTDRVPNGMVQAGGMLYMSLGTTSVNREIEGVSALGVAQGHNAVTGPLGGVAWMHVVNDKAFWIGGGPGRIDPDRLLMSPVNGNPGTMITVVEGIGLPAFRGDCLTSDGTYLFFVGETEPGVYAIRRVRLSDNAIDNLVPVAGGAACAVSGGQVYFEDRAGNALKRIPVDGGSAVTLASGVSFSETRSLLRVTESMVLLFDGVTLRSVPVAGGTVTQRLTDLLGGDPSAVVVGSVVYLHEAAATPQCVRVSLFDWSRSTRTSAGCEFADATSLYWMDRSAANEEGNQGFALLKARR